MHSDAQKQFKIIITKSTNLESKKFSCSLSDCSAYTPVQNSFVNNKLTITGKYFSKYITLEIDYDENNDTLSFSNQFFVNSMQAEIELFTIKQNGRDVIHYKLKNALDYTSSDFNLKLQEFCKDENKAMDIFWKQKPSNWYDNDSLKQVLKYKLGKINDKQLEYIKQYPSNYFSIWLFNTQLVSRADAANSFALLKFFNETFSTQLKETYEGKETKRTLTGFTKAIVNNKAPEIIATDINGKTIRLEDYKNKYVLLIFWASWCAPCREEIPVINTVREEFPEEKLKIIGITSDDSLNDYLSAISKNNMKWINLKRDNRLNEAYGVTAIPSVFLINKDGIIIYKASVFDKDKIVELIKN